MKLPKDITRCANDKCVLRQNCKRYLAEPNGEPSWFSDFKPLKRKCNHQIKVESKNDVK